MKRKDWLILSHLRKNARSTLTQISRKTYIPVTTVYDHLRKYEQKLIMKNACLLDFKKIGFKSKAKIAVRVDNNQRDFVKNLIEHPLVNSLYRLSADFDANFDFMIELIAREQRDIDNFIRDLKRDFPVSNSLIFNVTEDLKREEFLSDSEGERIQPYLQTV
ncbi:Lrp/AsnC family transcriptional regulator [Thermoproteota archaeon]